MIKNETLYLLSLSVIFCLSHSLTQQGDCWFCSKFQKANLYYHKSYLDQHVQRYQQCKSIFVFNNHNMKSKVFPIPINGDRLESAFIYSRNQFSFKSISVPTTYMRDPSRRCQNERNKLSTLISEVQITFGYWFHLFLKYLFFSFSYRKNRHFVRFMKVAIFCCWPSYRIAVRFLYEISFLRALSM